MLLEYNRSRSIYDKRDQYYEEKQDKHKWEERRNKEEKQKQSCIKLQEMKKFFSKKD